MYAGLAGVILIFFGQAATASAAPTVESLLARLEAQDQVIQTLAERIRGLEAGQSVPQLPSSRGWEDEAQPEAPGSAPMRTASASPVATSAARISPPVRSDSNAQALSLKGRLEFDAWLSDTGSSQAQVRRARIGIDGGDPSSTSYTMSVEFASGSAVLLETYLSFVAGERTLLRLGRQRIPFSLVSQTSENYSNFLERPVGIEPFLPGYAVGLSLASRGATWSFQAGAYSKASVAGADDDLYLAGRISWLPWQKDGGRYLHLGGAANHAWISDNGGFYLRQRPERWTGDFALDGGLVRADALTRVGLEAAYSTGPFGGVVEGAWMRVDRPSLDDISYDGFSAEVWWTLTGEPRPYSSNGGVFARLTPSRTTDAGGPGAWQIVGRFSELDLEDALLNVGHIRTQALGLNWYLNQALRLVLDLSHTTTTTHLTTLDQTGVGFRAHVDW